MPVWVWMQTQKRFHYFSFPELCELCNPAVLSLFVRNWSKKIPASKKAQRWKLPSWPIECRYQKIYRLLSCNSRHMYTETDVILSDRLNMTPIVSCNYRQMKNNLPYFKYFSLPELASRYNTIDIIAAANPDCINIEPILRCFKFINFTFRIVKIFAFSFIFWRMTFSPTSFCMEISVFWPYLFTTDSASFQNCSVLRRQEQLSFLNYFHLSYKIQNWFVDASNFASLSMIQLPLTWQVFVVFQALLKLVFYFAFTESKKTNY